MLYFKVQYKYNKKYLINKQKKFKFNLVVSYKALIFVYNKTKKEKHEHRKNRKLI